MNDRPARILLLFLDGIGIGVDDPRLNPFSLARLPAFDELLGGRRLVDATFSSGPIASRSGHGCVVDSTMGMPGLPQSGTGQTALLTGLNAASLFGRHFGSWVPTPLREPLRTRNLLTRAAGAGRSIAFANANPPVRQPDRRPSGPFVAALGSGARWRGADELRRGEAVASSITNDRWIAHLPAGGIAPISAGDAGRNLGRIARRAELTLFAHYDTDFAGHAGSLEEGVAVLERVDTFLAGVVDTLPGDALVVIASDHGNLEDVRVGHTRNPVPVLAWGPGAGVLVSELRSITEVAPRLLRLLGIDD